METGRNIAFIVVAAFILCSVIAYAAAGAVVPALKLPEKSSLEGRAYTTTSDLLASSFVTGAGQDVFEQYVSDRVPLREQAILASAGLQRQGIATAAALVGYPVYPTYFDSTYTVDHEGDYIYKRAQAAPKDLRALDGLIDTVNEAVEEHKRVRFVTVAALKSEQMEANPAYDIARKKKTFDEEWVQENYLDKLDDSVSTHIASAVNIEEMREGWFGTDTHWTPRRALESYNWIASQLDLEQVEWDESREVLVTPAWVGISARLGRDFDATSELVDLVDDFSDLDYYALKEGKKKKKGEKFVPGERNAFLKGKVSADDKSLRYDAYTHYYGDAKNAIVKNTGPNNGKTCVLVSDSFGYCLHRYIARNYERTIVIYPGNVKVNHDLSWFIKQFKADDVIMITNGKKYPNMEEKSPKFIGLK